MSKVLLVRNANYEDFGGGERFPVFLAMALQSQGYKTAIVARSDKILHFAKLNHIKTIKGWWWSRQNWSGARLILLPFYLIWQVVLIAWYSLLFLKEKPKVVHLMSKDDFIAGTLAAKMQGMQVIWTDHADLKHIWLNVTVWYKSPVGKLVYFAAKLSDKIIVVSANEKRLVCNNLPIGSRLVGKIKIIYNGAFDEKPKAIKAGNKDVTFCIASRLVTDKGIAEAISAFKKLSDKHSRARLVVLGTGPEAGKFHSQAEGCKGIEFLGHVDEPLGQMAACDVFLQPTYHEAFSVVLVEACMLGKAIIATNVGGNPEIISDGENGLLVEPRNAKALHAAMLKLYEDEHLRNRLGSSARKAYLAKFDFAKIATEYVECYES